MLCVLVVLFCAVSALFASVCFLSFMEKEGQRIVWSWAAFARHAAICIILMLLCSTACSNFQRFSGFSHNLEVRVRTHDDSYLRHFLSPFPAAAPEAVTSGRSLLSQSLQRLIELFRSRKDKSAAADDWNDFSVFCHRIIRSQFVVRDRDIHM